MSFHRLALRLLGVAAAFAAARAETIIVNSPIDVADPADGLCTLREALSSALNNWTSGGVPKECPAGDADDKIVFEFVTPETILLNSSLASYFSSAPAGALEIDGANKVTVDGQGMYFFLRIYADAADSSIAIANMKVTRSPKAISSIGDVSLRIDNVKFLNNDASGEGGAIDWASGSADITIRNSVFGGNAAANAPQGASGYGGAISYAVECDELGAGDPAQLTIVASTFSNNKADEEGGAVHIYTRNAADQTSPCAEFLIRDSTFSNNEAGQNGGAIAISRRVYAIDNLRGAIAHATISDNVADADGDGVGDGGGVYTEIEFSPRKNDLGVTLFNSVIAGNQDGSTQAEGKHPDISGKFHSAGFNIIGVKAGAISPVPWEPTDQVGVKGARINPRLSPLAINGGSTPTMPPRSGSPAVDNGRCSSVHVATKDQRGEPRPVDLPSVPSMVPGSDGCDVGAVELQ